MTETTKPVKFLLIRFSSIGDIVLTTPVIRNLKQQTSGAEIHFLTKKKFISVLEGNPYLEKIHPLDKSFRSTIRELKAENFDYIIDLHRNLRSKRVKLALKRISFSFNKLNFRKWLLVNFKINRLPEKHIVDRYLDTITLFIDAPDKKGLDYFIPSTQNFPELPKTPYVVIVIGANHFTKQMPLEKLQSLCNSIHKPQILIGGPDDKERAYSLAKMLKVEPLNYTGRLTLNQSAMIISLADWVITPDTGMMHIAAAFQRKIISVWGNTIPAFGMGPYRPHEASALFEVKGLKCRPCSKIGYSKCPRNHFKCMNLQDVEKMASLANS